MKILGHKAFFVVKKLFHEKNFKSCLFKCLYHDLKFVTYVTKQILHVT